MDKQDRQTIEMMTVQAVAVEEQPEPEPNLCRCCRRNLLIWEDRCFWCGAIVVLREAT
jgi:hypothetical protein